MLDMNAKKYMKSTKVAIYILKHNLNLPLPTNYTIQYL